MGLKAKLEADMKSAMKTGDKERLSVIRMILSEIKNQEIKTGGALQENEITALLSRTVKRHKESISQFQIGKREDLVQKETKELGMVLEYLPPPLSVEELREIIKKVIAETGAGSMKEMGAVMKKVMAEAAGRADGKQVQQLVQKSLS
ncbi:MAG: hypothetical protein CO150_03785 [Nitrospirae bacterium CG_4_9_14_3_um_filter_53_35]|nr:MAG: hypothetical protein AUK29_02940 [Nitrospirae bacterium CG2_30_53_67]PIS38224.1 MAG: hypothetical protein COT35_01930 [Nitrospirae bacterium CG08_land_8_20_14_0_20_52_24]PIV83261.1 MAG: hypothetical protein COW52_09195 [Nitrospirae bacterium CG17_big_fil_post_rev_8_21_14_2_50_50_9]PIW84218.1 MAG: hypothetical protein COZ95_10950 [Nitrospirae bacterium CG_4_8_14_3_um_filter_50_41]PIX84632.1 MAG: hypothetical protein COZ32_12675 [Nitrospirae bacterium CG_4_10_14_3_um_filter_53_41]PJA7611